MHKKLEADLISLAHSILQLKNKEDVFALKEISKEIYEKLSLLAFVEEYVNTTPALEETTEELISKVEKGLELQEKSKEDISIDIEAIEEIDEVVVEEIQVEEEQIVLPIEETIEQEIVEEIAVEEVKEEVKVAVEEIIEQPFAELEEIMFAEPEPAEIKEVVKAKESKVLSLEEELEDTISVDEMATLFDIPVQKSLNDRLTTNIQIGLNDRIAFVKNLFDGSQEDFNRVVSQLNTYPTEKEAKKFINKMVKPDYDWSTQEALEARFMEIIERRFA
ncbi:hypothetical protein [Polaribacter butkevichii]|uniref:Uncharacterized protein n=1 Tax=Polaribacter butkevichii TaxID=218490 RepID=A0A2P6C869_9FLAO|nr:hypothetical protein [Polaribacter butkevichii]PQJ69128.1 hypothetical protein BTO14_13945 [Polaribacter butkevichii]